jgi:hypothetical protein
VNGSVAHTSAFFGPQRTLEFTGALEPVNDQGAGFGGTLSDFPAAAFTTGNAGQPIRLYAWSGASTGTETLTPLPGVRLHDVHRFRIEWGASSVAFFVDGAQVATHAVTIAGSMRPVASDFRPFGAGVRVHWLRQGAYATSGNLVSRTLDSGRTVAEWQALTADRTTPGGTQIAFDTRSGPTPQPDAGWSAWQPVAGDGTIASPDARYIQYRARLTSAAGVSTPTLRRVAVGFDTGS